MKAGDDDTTLRPPPERPLPKRRRPFLRVLWLLTQATRELTEAGEETASSLRGVRGALLDEDGGVIADVKELMEHVGTGPTPPPLSLMGRMQRIESILKRVEDKLDRSLNLEEQLPLMNARITALEDKAAE